MALRNILKDGDPGLLKKSRAVTDFNSRLHLLLDDMRETLVNASGLGLAAPQVGVLRRVVLIVKTDEPDEPDGHEGADEDIEPDETIEPDEPEELPLEERIVELVNPEIVSSCGENSRSEGCLSLPGRYGIVTRPQSVFVKAQDRFGNNMELDAHGMTARAVCHEIDHLDGIIFTSIAQRMLSQEEIDEMNKSD